MPITIICPGCNSRFDNVPDTVVGKRTSCPRCRASIHVPPPLLAEPVAFDDEGELNPPPIEPRREERRPPRRDFDEEHRSPPPRRAEASPFAWGFGVAIGVVVALLVLVVAMFVICMGFNVYLDSFRAR